MPAVKVDPQRMYPALALATVLAGMADHQRAHQVTETALIGALAAQVWQSRNDLSPTDLALLLTMLGTAAAGGWNMATSTHQPDPHGVRSGFLRGVAGFSVSQAATLALLHRSGATSHAGQWPVRALLTGVGLSLIAARDPRNVPALSGYGALLNAAALLAAHPHVNERSGRLGRGGWFFLTSDLLILVRRYLLRGRAERAVTEGVMLALYAGAQRELVSGLLEQRRAGP